MHFPSVRHPSTLQKGFPLPFCKPTLNLQLLFPKLPKFHIGLSLANNFGMMGNFPSSLLQVFLPMNLLEWSNHEIMFKSFLYFYSGLGKGDGRDLYFEVICKNKRIFECRFENALNCQVRCFSHDTVIQAANFTKCKIIIKSCMYILMHAVKPRPEAHMDIILFEVFLKNIHLIPQDQIVQWHYL